MTKTTQCPACQTRFKVSDAQLAAANGLVRCGRCAHVFNATDHLVELAEPLRPAAPVAPQPAAPEQPAPIPQPAPVATPPAAPLSPRAEPVANIDDFELEVPDFDPLAATQAETAPGSLAEALPNDGPSPEDVEAFQQALNDALHNTAASSPIGNPFDETEDEPAPVPPEQTKPVIPFDDGLDDEVPAIFDTRRTAAPATDIPAPEPEPAVEPEQQPATVEPAEQPANYDPATGHDDGAQKTRRPWLTVLLVLLSLLGLLAVAAQLVYLNRTDIAAQAPETRPVLERLCKQLGCTVPLSTDQEFIRTEWSELSFVPEHPNLVQLSAILKNHANYPQAYPMLEVTLKDADNQVLIRKVFTPRDYRKQEDLKTASIASNAQEKVTMRFDVGKVHAQGYSLYWFYP